MYDNYAIAWKPPPAAAARRMARWEQAASVAAAARELVPWLAAAALVALGSTLQTFALTRYALAPWRERFSIMLCPRKS